MNVILYIRRDVNYWNRECDHQVYTNKSSLNQNFNSIFKIGYFELRQKLFDIASTTYKQKFSVVVNICDEQLFQVSKLLNNFYVLGTDDDDWLPTDINKVLLGCKDNFLFWNCIVLDLFKCSCSLVTQPRMNNQVALSTQSVYGNDELSQVFGNHRPNTFQEYGEGDYRKLYLMRPNDFVDISSLLEYPCVKITGLHSKSLCSPIVHLQTRVDYKPTLVLQLQKHVGYLGKILNNTNLTKVEQTLIDGYSTQVQMLYNIYKDILSRSV